MSEKRRGGAIARRMFVGTALVLLVALGAAVAVTSVLGERIAARDARERIQGSAAVLAVSQQQRFQQLSLLAEILAGSPEFKAYLLDAISAGDRTSIVDQLDERRAELGYDVAIVTDAQGVLVARTDLPELSGVDLSERPLFARVRTEFESVGIWADRGRLYEAAAVPMVFHDAIFGFLALGYTITDLRALEVKRGTGSDTIYLAEPDGPALASSLTPQETERALAALRAEGDLLARVAAAGEEPPPQELRLGGRRFLAQLAPLRDAGKGALGARVTLVSLDRELEGFAEIRRVLVGVGLLALAAALAFSYLLARRVSRPIGDLVRATTAAREGRYDVTIPPGGSGEVLTLANSFNALLAELRERREMAEYVEKLARNLPESGARVGRALPDEPAAVRNLALLGVELRRYARPRGTREAAVTLERLTRDLRRIANLVGAQGGRIEALSGHRVLASFAGPGRAEAALAAAADLFGVFGGRENAFDEPAPPAIAISAGELTGGTVSWGEEGARALVGLPLQTLEALLRETGEGELLLAPVVAAELGEALARAGLELAPRRGLLSTQPLFLLNAADALRISEAAGRFVTYQTGTGAPAPAGTLDDIGPGSLLGSRFEVLGVLGAGGMGVVYKARDRELDDLVALKMLRRDVAGDQVLVSRLKTELKLARRITHPNVLRTFDFGEVDGHAFISMELVRGITLRAMLEDAGDSGRLPFAAAMRLARQLVGGLAAAHALEILHRDIKPENAILDPAGNLKLMDFGLARPVERRERGETREGWIVGTPHYIAPEQIEGREPDKRSDVYACGVVLFELFTGRLPFDGGTPMEVLSKHLREEPPRPASFWLEIPPALEALVLRCLAKDPERRPADAAALLAELERAA
jgi:eukaryotic-like serine/threonine-protein kinase